MTFEVTKGVGAYVTNPVVRIFVDTLLSTVASLDNAPLRFNAVRRRLFVKNRRLSMNVDRVSFLDLCFRVSVVVGVGVRFASIDHE